MKERIVRFLRWTEKYTKTDMVYFAKGNFWLNVNKVLSIINGLVLSVAFANLLTKEEYGTYAFALAFLGLFSMAQTTGIASGIGKAVARGEHYMLFEGLRRILPWSLFGSILLGISGGYYFINGNAMLGIVFALGALVLPASVSAGVAKSFFAFKGEFEKPAKYNLIRTPISTAILLFIAVLTRSTFWILIGNILLNVILAYFLYRIMRRSYDFSPQPVAHEKFASKFALHTGFLSIVSYLSEKLDQLLLWKLLGAAPVAVYTYAITPVREIRSMVENQSLLAMPKFAKKEFSEVRRALPFRIKQMYFLSVPLVVIYIFIAPKLFSVLFPQYIDAVALSQFAALSLLSSPRRLMAVAISAHQKIKESYVMIVLPNAIRIVIALVLIPLFGIKGAIAALLVSELIEYVILGLLVQMLGKTNEV
jgi:O-antigen/teichoic acid export membrane protein